MTDEANTDAWTDKVEDKKDELTDKLGHKKDDLVGKAKEAEGKVTGDKSRENEGKMDQVKSDFKEAVDKVKDAFHH
jgi:uncharacterized protein YjbJ (UPF0337 family)